MPRLVHQNPSYRKHKASGQAIVCLNGERIYLGPFGSKASRDAYDRHIGEWLASGRQRAVNKGDGLFVTELIAAFWTHAKTEYRVEVGDDYAGNDVEIEKHEDGTVTRYRPTGERDNYRLAIRPLRRLYGNIPAADFGPQALKGVRAEMIRMGWTRKNINRQVGRIKHVFSWGGEQEIIPPTISHGLAVVKGLKKGKEGVKESAKVRPVAMENVDPILKLLPSQVRAIVELQNHSAARQSELFVMRGCDIARKVVAGKPLWEYRPHQHKGTHLDDERIIKFGAEGQAIIGLFLKDDPQAYIFQPSDAVAEVKARRSAARITPLSCGNIPITNSRRSPKVKPGVPYNSHSYRRAITRACERAFGMPSELRRAPKAETAEAKAVRLAAARAWRKENVWTPHRLRHTAATRFRKEFGVDVAQTLIGHQLGSRITEVYADRDHEAASQAMVA